jgi:hypothetical protein
MYVIGDVHGKIKDYVAAIDSLPNPQCDRSIQVGDMSLDYSDLPFMANHRFLGGNHDNYGDYPAIHPNFLDDYGVWGDVFYVRGAYSIDRKYRTEGVSWWREEELTYIAMYEMLGTYSKLKPKTVISHDCPLFLYPNFGISAQGPSSKTSRVLEEMHEIHQPERWLFGHHHFSDTDTVGSTKFTCLNELEIFDLEKDEIFSPATTTEISSAI